MNSVVLISIGCIWVIAWYLLWRRCRGRDSLARPDYDVIAIGILFWLTVGYFWRTISGDVFQPADGGDLVSFLYPTYRFAAAQLSSGDLPLWNPTLYGGAPFIADIQAGYLYPPNLVFFLLRPTFPYTDLQWMSIGHLFWTGLGMYMLLRTLRWPSEPVIRTAAVFGAIAFQYSDPLLVHFGNLNLIAALSWMPWVFAAYVRALDSRRLAWAGAVGVLFAISIYAGHAQSSLYVGLGLAVYTAFRLLDEWRDLDTPSFRAIARVYIAPLFIVAATGLLLAAPILLPAMQLTQFTERSAFAYQDTVAYSLAPTQAIGLLTPGFFGRGPALHWGLWDRVELPYAGVGTLLMAIAAVILASTRVRRQLWPWLGLGLLAFVTAFGVYAIVHGWLTALLPVFDQFRAPARALVLWTFAVSVLGAVGVDLVARQGLARIDDAARPEALRAIMRFGAVILVGVVLPLTFLALLLTQENETVFLRTSIAALALALTTGFWTATWGLAEGRHAGWWSGKTFAALIVVLLFFDLAATGAYIDIGGQDPTAGFQQDEIVAYLQEQPGPVRIDTLTGIEAHWQPDTAALYGLQDVGGIANPLSLAHWHALMEATGGRGGSLYDMLNVGYVIVEDGTPLPEGKFELVLDAQGPLSVYRNPDVMPRAWLVHDGAAAADNETALKMLWLDGFDPATETVVVGESLPPMSESDGDEVTFVEYDNDHMVLNVSAGGDGLLVLSEVWYPGWRASVNGADTPVLAVNGGLRGVAVAAGESTVELRFEPMRWRMGLALTFVTALLLAAWGVYGLVVRRRGKD